MEHLAVHRPVREIGGRLDLAVLLDGQADIEHWHDFHTTWYDGQPPCSICTGPPVI